MQSLRWVIVIIFWMPALGLWGQVSVPPRTSDDARKDADRSKELLQQLEQPAGPVDTAPVSQLGFVRTKLFGIEAEGAKFVYVLDRSASMSEPKQLPLNAAKAELQRSLQAIGRVQQFYLVFYHHQPKLFQPGGEGGKLIFGTEQNKTAADKFIDGISAEGGTDHYAALQVALKIRPDVVFLLTDGDANDDLTNEQTAELERTNSGQAVIHVVQFTAGFATGANVRKLAEQNRGQFREVDIRQFK